MRLDGMRLNVAAGLLIGGFGVALTLLLFATGQLREPIGGRLAPLSLAVHAGTLVWALARHRKLAKPEPVSFARLVGAGLLISLVAGVVLFVGALALTTSIDPDYLPWLRESMTRDLEAAAADGLVADDALAAQRAEIDTLQPMSFALQWLTGPLVMGLLLTLPIAMLLRVGALRHARSSS